MAAGLLAASVLGLVASGEAGAGSRAHAASPPVAVRLGPLGQTDLLFTARAPVTLWLRRGEAVSVRIKLFARRRGPDIALGRARRLSLSAGRLRQIDLPLRPAGRAELADCTPERIVARVTARGFAGARSASALMRRDPPDCARFFDPASFWNTPLPADAPLDPDSEEITNELLRHVRASHDSGRPPSINTTAYTPPIYTVPPDQPKVRVRLDRPPGYDPELEEVLAAVPLPPDARPADGNDAELVVWQPATDTLWELAVLRRDAGGWLAGWGGRMEQVSTNQGVFTAPHASWGATATSLALAGGLILPRELRQGSIDHALALGIPRPREGEYALPAQRTDGVSKCPHSVPEGARFRLDPALDIDILGLAPPVATLARAAQRYGIVIRDWSESVAFYAQNSRTFPEDPYPEAFGGRPPHELIAEFPWSHLQLTRMELRLMEAEDALLPPPDDVLVGCG